MINILLPNKFEMPKKSIAGHNNVVEKNQITALTCRVHNITYNHKFWNSQE